MAKPTQARRETAQAVRHREQRQEDELHHPRATRQEQFPPELPFQPPDDADGYLLKPDPLTAQTAAEFVELMRLYRIWAGEPSYRELVKRARNAFGASTLCEALKSTHLPPEKLVRAFVWACTGSHEDLQAWITAWRWLRMRHQRPQSQPLAPVTALPTTVRPDTAG